MIINEDFFDTEVIDDIPAIPQEEKQETEIPDKGKYSFVFKFGLDGAAENLSDEKKAEVGKELKKFKMTVERILEPFCSYMSDVIYVMSYTNNWENNEVVYNMNLFGVPAVTNEELFDAMCSNTITAVVYFDYDNKSLMNALRFYASIVRIMTAFNHPEGFPVSILYGSSELYNTHRTIPEVSGSVTFARRASIIFKRVHPDRIQKMYLMLRENCLLAENALNFCRMVLNDYDNTINKETVENYIDKHNLKETAYKVENER